ncbi:YoaK family protein [Nocardioides houyundeii]|uniref:YoaK family protein n=1 Tax=Nocardioides houyundeii TaxID=2045452 RepID=UPI001F07B57A|nr:YoaK family protein [Nocardioides houyundeii]
MITGRLAVLPTDRVHLVLMLALTFATGVVDAVGYLGLDKVFTGNMTGNVVILGMALVGAEDLPIAGPVLALVGFMVGAALGGRVLKRAAGAWTRLTTRLFASVAVVMIGLAVLLLVTEAPGPAVALTVTTLLGAVMGVQAATARFIAVKDVTTVVVTSTITGLAADSVFGSGKAKASGGGSGRRFLAVVLILAGATTGAALLTLHIGAGLMVAGLIVLLVTSAGALHDRAARNGGETLSGRPPVHRVAIEEHRLASQVYGSDSQC